jgi:hypothetical protein
MIRTQKKQEKGVPLRVGAAPGYPPVGAAHCAQSAHPPPASRVFARFQHFFQNRSGFQPKGLEKSIENRAYVKM